MAGQTTNFGWDFVNSGADPVSGPANFAHVQQIDTTLSQIAGPIRSVRFGVTRAIPTGGTGETAVKHYVVTYPTMIGEVFTCFLREGTTRPDSVTGSTAVNASATQFDLYTYRANSTTQYDVFWVVFGITAFVP